MARGVASASERLTDLTDLHGKAWVERIEQARFPNAGIACKGRQLAGNTLPQLGNAIPCFGACEQKRKSRLFIDGAQLVGMVEVRFVDADQDLAALQRGDGGHAVDEIRIGLRDGVRRHDHELVDVGDRRTRKNVAPRLDGINHALPAGYRDLHPVADKRRNALLTEAPARAAGHDPLAGIDIVKAAEGLFDPSSHAASGGIPSVPETEGSGPSLTVSTISAPVVTTVSCAMLCSTTVPASASL